MNKGQIATIGIWGMLAGLGAWATPPNQARLDGRPLEYDATDWRGGLVGASQWGAANVITNLYVTWDTNYLYVALQGWIGEDKKMTVLMDVDPGSGTGATTTTNWTGLNPPYIMFNDVGWRVAPEPYATNAFGLDYMLATEGFYNDILRITYDGENLDTNKIEAVFTEGNGVEPRGTPTDMVMQDDTNACPLKGFEARIPWGVLYNSSRFGTINAGEIVPRGAKLRLFANMHNNNALVCWSSPDAIPPQTTWPARYEYVGSNMAMLTTAFYVDVPVDANDDGLPDVAVGDVNAPYLRRVQGAAGGQQIYAEFNEDVDAAAAENAANWTVTVGGTNYQPQGVQAAQGRVALLALTNRLPAAGGIAGVTVTGVPDTNANQRTTSLCLFPAAGGISLAVAVRFHLETASGLGIDPGATAYFLNGTEPLEWNYPPSMSAPMALEGGTVYSRDVIFPPGTPSTIFYKYSGVLANTGTNTYEAVRLTDFGAGARQLPLSADGAAMAVTDYLGAAAGPWRDPLAGDGQARLFQDARRGDAGVRERCVVTFQLDLSRRDLRGVERVMVQGSDPLRGFNYDGTNSDYAGGGGVGWANGGVTLYDDGSHGDPAAGDGVYARAWSFTTSGQDAAMEAGAPHSLVGGNTATPPYLGTHWLDGRSPRSFIYKYYVVTGGVYGLESPGTNIERYLSLDDTNAVLAPFVWDNNALPYQFFSNEPVIVAVARTSAAVVVTFTNVVQQEQYGAEIASAPGAEWGDYSSSPSGSQGVWQVTFPSSGDREIYRVYSGPSQPYHHTWWVPSIVPGAGSSIRVWYCQNHRALAGYRDLKLHIGITNDAPWADVPMVFDGRGLWHCDVEIPGHAGRTAGFTVVDPDNSINDRLNGAWPDGRDYQVQVGGRALWSPDPVAPGEALTVVYNAADGPLAGLTNLYLHGGFDDWEAGPAWNDHTNAPMTQVADNRWQVTITVPTWRTKTVNFVFKDAAESHWDNNNGNNWTVFIDP